ncbi:MAG TPA: DNA-processing protein DprA, partial [Acidobacteriota bacterium]|nr:DNA-processing protein DprA [Acidobacteriota bacterium]
IFEVALNMVEGLKPVHRAALLRAFGNAEEVFRQTEMDLASKAGIRSELAYRILQWDIRQTEKELERARNSGIRVLSLTDDSYPSLLRMIPDPPLVLYVRGDLEPNEPCVAMVGSRKATPYGLNVTQLFSKDLAAAGVTIVSGLARGIDAAAHNAALNAGGRTLAVLGSGVDIIYPAEHRNLADRIAAGGAVLSEYPLGTPPNRENFPIRNRIISGLCAAVVIVEASMKSGSLITARMAMEQGREVLAVPGSVFNESSQGCHALIRDGAALAQSWKDVAQALPEEISRKISVVDERPETDESDLTDREKSIIALLSFEQPRHVDQLAGLAGMQAQDVLGTLVGLELKNYIEQMPGKQFIRLK